MSYKKAKSLLPAELVELIQKYVDGEYIYIPRREEKKRKKAGVPVRLQEKNWHQEILVFIMIIYREWK